MDRREFLKLMARAGALTAMGGYSLSCSSSSDTPLETRPTVDYLSRNRDGSLTPYLVIPKLDNYHDDDPVWNTWAGSAWTDFVHPPHGFWFLVPELNESVDVVVPVINLGNMTTRHLVIELYEGPHAGTLSLSDCALVERRGPFTLHPGRITGFPMRYTRKREDGASVAICYDPFYDPIHSIASVGALSPDRKNLGNCDGIIPPGYPNYYGF
ncbi:MAG: hypothetical protein KKD44_03520 [Proteobacteria bacterium]|nr:hypothetical protein [Pseudomonadota bacterium]